MKAFKISLLAALITSPLAAQDIDKTWEIGVFGEYIKSSTNKEYNLDWKQIESGRGIGIDLQKIINQQWDVRFELATDRYNINNGNGTEYGSRFGIDAIYKIEDSGLYVFAGAKRFNNTNSYNALNAGAGYNLAINDRVSIYSEAAVYRDIDNGFTDQGLKVGFKYAFGDVKKAPVVKKVAATSPMRIDSDKDGIRDEQDNCPNTHTNVKVDSKGCALYSEKSVAITMNVTFENNSAKVKPAEVNDIHRLADFMKEYTNTSVVIEGHSSAIGAEAYNLNLSQQRADKVKEILVNEFSVDASRLKTKGLGETQLIATGNEHEDHELNRRVIAKIETIVKEEIIKE